MSSHDFSTLALPIEPGDWCDADNRIFHACFTILGQFVEDELKVRDDTPQDEIYRGYRPHFEGAEHPKAIDLWLWYRDELPALEKAYDDDVSECFSGKLVTEPAGDGLRRIVSLGKVREPKFPHDYPGTVRNEKLWELMTIRRSLWT